MEYVFLLSHGVKSKIRGKNAVNLGSAQLEARWGKSLVIGIYGRPETLRFFFFLLL